MQTSTAFNSPNYNNRMHPIDILLMHYTGMATAQEALERLCDKHSTVSAHYMIDEEGRIYKLVDEEKRAWHAGISYWKGERDINSRSIGIEIVNPGHAGGYPPFPEKQIEAVINLSKEIIERWKIKSENVLGHSDVAPTRKEDPGELFPWRQLAQHGIGIWTDNFRPPNKETTFMLQDIGYDISNENAALRAFQRHYYPEAFTLSDQENMTVERLSAVFEYLKTVK